MVNMKMGGKSGFKIKQSQTLNSPLMLEQLIVERNKVEVANLKLNSALLRYLLM